MTAPWLSIIMPNYNGAAYIREAIDSVVAQNEPDVELIVVDDGSNDDSLRIARTYERRLRMSIIEPGRRGNWVAMTNVGMMAARGEFLCWLHNDDTWLAGRLAQMRRLVERLPGATLYTHCCRYIDHRGRRVGMLHAPLPAGRELPPNFVLPKLLIQNFFSPPALFFRRRDAEAVGWMDDRLWFVADWDFGLKLAALGPTVYHDAPLACYRIHPASLTTRVAHRSWAGQTIGETYERAMRHRGWHESVPGLRTRGIPYADRGELQTFLHMGLWSNVPDRDAVAELAAMAKGELLGGFMPPAGRRVVNDRQYFPMCAMNLAFRRELAPALYFPLMGAGQPYGRFDDIWGGLIAQRVCRHLRMPISIGEPHIEHRRASDPFINLKKEAPGIAAHERMWRVIDACELCGGEPIECVQEMSRQLSRDQDEYTRTLGQSLGVWASLFEDRPQPSQAIRQRIAAPALVGASDGRGG